MIIFYRRILPGWSAGREQFSVKKFMRMSAYISEGNDDDDKVIII